MMDLFIYVQASHFLFYLSLIFLKLKKDKFMKLILSTFKSQEKHIYLA